MDFFSEREWWPKGDLNSVGEQLKRDLPEVFYKDPFIEGLRKNARQGIWNDQDFKSQYWPSLIGSLNHENPFVRTLSLSMLIHEDNPEVKRVIWNHFQDPFPLCRLLIIQSFVTENRSRMYHELFLLMTKDPVVWIRRAARKRLQKDFTDMHSFQFNNFEEREKYHLLDLLDLNTAADRKLIQNHLKESSELSLKIQWMLKHRLVAGKLLMDPEDTPLKQNWIKSHLISVEDHMDIESMEDSSAALRALQWLKDPCEKAGLLNFCNVLFFLEDRAGIKVELLDQLIDLIAQLQQPQRSELLEVLIEQGDWQGEAQDILLKILQHHNFSQDDKWLWILLGRKSFDLNEKWLDSLCTVENPELYRILVQWLETLSREDLLFQRALRIMAHCETDHFSSLVEILCNRREKDKEFHFFSQGVFKDIIQWNPVGMDKFISSVEGKKHWGFIPYWLISLDEKLWKKWKSKLLMILPHWNCQWKIDMLASLLALNRKENFSILLEYMGDPSREVRSFIQAVFSEKLSPREKELIKEYEVAK